jgi:hypothetical protein
LIKLLDMIEFKSEPALAEVTDVFPYPLTRLRWKGTLTGVVGTYRDNGMEGWLG